MKSLASSDSIKVRYELATNRLLTAFGKVLRIKWPGKFWTEARDSINLHASTLYANVRQEFIVPGYTGNTANPVAGSRIAACRRTQSRAFPGCTRSSIVYRVTWLSYPPCIHQQLKRKAPRFQLHRDNRRAALPDHHLSTDSKDAVEVGMALVATMCAIVLGLLVSSAKSSYDAQSTELTEMSAKFVLLDRVLAHYAGYERTSRDPPELPQRPRWTDRNLQFPANLPGWSLRSPGRNPYSTRFKGTLRRMKHSALCNPKLPTLDSI
jgi:hypothetical protein